MVSLSALLVICPLMAMLNARVAATSHAGLGPNMTQAELTGILSRAITMTGWLSPTVNTDGRTSKNVTDSIRFLTNIGAKYAGRSMFMWGHETILPKMLKAAHPNAVAVHSSNKDLVLEACVFEIVTIAVENLSIPSYVFEAFGLPLEQRNFNYSAMLFPDKSFVDHWGPNQSVPDYMQQETQMWVFFVASQYIQGAEVEALHMGQVMLMARDDSGMLVTASIFAKIREFAAKHARRGFVLLNAHVFEDPWIHLNHTQQLIFDFHAFPSRPKPDVSAPQHCTLEAGFENAMYGKSAGGISVSGWTCDHLPYIVELDNYDCTKHPGVQDPKDTEHPFGWDEISWFAHQPVAYRNQWLAYAADWLKTNDPVGHFEMPGVRALCDPHFADRATIDHYSATATAPDGFSQEAAIKAIWLNESFERMPASADHDFVLV